MDKDKKNKEFDNGVRPSYPISDDLEDLKRRYTPEQLQKMWDGCYPKLSEISGEDYDSKINLDKQMNPTLIKDFHSFMEKELEGFKIYTDTPENRFEHTPESIWFINPKTKGWVIELEKSGKLLYNYGLYYNFSKSFNDELSVFEQLIVMWVDDVLKRGVSTTGLSRLSFGWRVEDVIKRGVSTNINSEKIITPISEIEADTRRVCEIRFDCLVTMHDVGFKKYKGMWGQEKRSKTPQWFKSNQVITLEEIKYSDPYQLGMRMKEMFNQLEKTVERYEQSR
jgi:hypothetical protein